MLRVSHEQKYKLPRHPFIAFFQDTLLLIEPPESALITTSKSSTFPCDLQMEQPTIDPHELQIP
jgi:hypothetical protein